MTNIWTVSSAFVLGAIVCGIVALMTTGPEEKVTTNG